jgi:hypothetical protein
MNDDRSENQKEFFVTGVKSYLDVRDAMEEFCRQVRDQCATVVHRRLDEINLACKMGWTENNLSDYRYFFPPSYPDAAHLGKKISVGALGTEGGLYFYLMFPRRRDNPVYEAQVNLYRGRQDVAVDLWASFTGTGSDTAFKTSNALIFKRALPEDKLADLVGYLTEATEDFIIFMSRVEGLKKYLVRGA